MCPSGSLLDDAPTGESLPNTPVPRPLYGWPTYTANLCPIHCGWPGESPKGTHDHFAQLKLGLQEFFVGPDCQRREPAKTVLLGLSW